MDRADIIKKNRNEWFDEACKYKAENKKLQAELKAKDELLKEFLLVYPKCYWRIRWNC